MAIAVSEMSMTDYVEVTAFWSGMEGVGLNECDNAENIATFLLRNPGTSLVARDDGQVVGAVLCGHDGRRGYLDHLAVAVSHRGRGLGRRLVEEGIEHLIACGVRRCNVFVYDSNDEGKRFWEAMGYKERSELRVMQRPIGR